MNVLLVLRAMILKELRTMMRERQQLFGLVISLLAMTAAMVVPALKTGHSLPSANVHSGPWQPFETSLVRWIAIAGGFAVSMFFSMGYLISAIVVSFAGEKESKTLELVLASPVRDTLLFTGKCIGVLVPPVALGWLLIALAAVAAKTFYGGPLAQIPVYWGLYLLVATIPLTLLASLFFVGIGAAISAKADTAKGAGQALGVVFMVIFFGGGYGLPLLVQFLHLQPQLTQLAKAWLTWPFAWQYGGILLLIGTPAIISLTIGRLLFHRDRLLT